MTAPCRILHIITSLQMGGAEMALYRLVSTLDPNLFQQSVISLTREQPVGDFIRSAGIPVESLGLSPGFPDPRGIFRLKQKVSAACPGYCSNVDVSCGFSGRHCGETGRSLSGDLEYSSYNNR